MNGIGALPCGCGRFGGISSRLITAHPRFAVEAFQMKADYMVFKPFDRDDIQDVLERARLLHTAPEKTRGVPHLRQLRDAGGRNARAICLRQGKGAHGAMRVLRRAQRRHPTTSSSIFARAARTRPRRTPAIARTIKELTDTLKACNAEDLFVRERGSCRIRRELVSCDYYDFWRARRTRSHASTAGS